MEYTANPGYWMGTPPFSTVILRPIADFAVAAAQLQAGDLDFAAGDARRPPVPGGRRPAVGHRRGAVPDPVGLQQLASSVMKDPQVRQAFMHGCDRQGFVDSFL